MVASTPAWHMSTVPQFFVHHYWTFIRTTDTAVATYYRPLLLVSEFLISRVAGTSTMIWHAFAVALHVAVTYLVYRMTLHLMASAVAAVTSAILFGLHPAHVEVVAWVSGVSESLSAAFVIGAFICWLRRQPGSAWYGTPAVALYCGALLTKETAVLFPVIVLVYELSRERLMPALRAVSPFVLVTVVYLVLRRAVLGGVISGLTNIPAHILFATWPSVAVFYLRHLVWPLHLSYLYPLPLQNHFTAASIMTMVLMIAGLAALAAMRSARLPVVGACLFLTPVFYFNGLSNLGIVHDRYLYLPSVGFCLLCGIAMNRLFTKHRRAALIGGACVVPLLAGATIAECRPWQDEIALFRRALAVNPGDRRVLIPLAVALETNDKCDEAVPLTEEALNGGDDAVLRVALGACYLRQSLPADAAAQFEQAIALKPDDVVAHLMLALLRVSERRFTDAEGHLQTVAAAHGTEWPGFHLLRGRVLEAQQDFSGAAREFRRELDLNPGSQEAQDALDAIDRKTGRP